MKNPSKRNSSSSRRFWRAKDPNAGLSESFHALWRSLFETPIHLDSALSKLPKEFKSKLAPVIPEILRKPMSLAKAAGLPADSRAFWRLEPERKAEWPLAWDLASRLMQNPSLALTPGSLDDFPDEFVEELHGAEQLAQTLTLSPPLTARGVRRIDRTTLIRQLSESLPGLKASPYSPVGFFSDGYQAVHGTPGFKEGLFEIQDEGSQILAAYTLWPENFAGFLTPEPGEPREQFVILPSSALMTVIDACSGAGGKTLALADFMKAKGRVYAYDPSLPKLTALRKRAIRAHLNNIQVKQIDEKLESFGVEKFFGTADRVLVDAPCTGWGVLKRNPDIKWRQNEGDRLRLPLLQRKLLDAYSQLVKPDGILVYGVCTFRKSETSDQVKRFLESHTDFSLVSQGYFGPALTTDGFFMAALKKSI
jgi:16S rRNA C967 or C1407 C5-methylase (RsmB/RsmF family)